MRVLLRCDGGGSLGVGHVMRALALAEAAVAAGHQVMVAGQFEGSFLLDQLAAAPVEVVPLGESTSSVAEGDLQPLVDLVRQLRPDVLHVDSYLTTDRLRELVAPVGAEAVAGTMVVSKMVVSNVEDGTFGRRAADVVVDPTFGAELIPRPKDGSAWLLRGSRYTPVRQRVIDARRPDTAGLETAGGQVAGSVLVVMGGTDPMGLAPAAVDLLARTGLALAVTVIATGENAERARIAAQGSGLSLNVLSPVNDLAARMAAHDLVVSAAGTSIWELCCIGVPAAVVWAVDNQREGYDRMVAAGAVIGLGGPELGADQPDERAVDLLRTALTDPRVRDAVVLAGRHVVDGLGAWRVVRTWEMAQRQDRGAGRPGSPASAGASQIGASDLVARPATLQDSRQLWLWRNDPLTRAGSRSPDVVSWDDHVRWFTDTLARTDPAGRVLLVVEDPVGSVGTVRWDVAGDPAESGQWEVSITVAPQRRGQSLARPLLRAAELALSKMTQSAGSEVAAYLAVVHIDNHASTRLFETSGYLPDLPPDQRGFMRYRKTARVP